jgi:hypothetical protein
MNKLLQYLFQLVWRLLRRLLSLPRRVRYEREMEEEMRFHLEMQIEQNLASGMTAEEALYAARRQFGNQTWLKEASREMWRRNNPGGLRIERGPAVGAGADASLDQFDLPRSDIEWRKRDRPADVHLDCDVIDRGGAAGLLDTRAAGGESRSDGVAAL